MKQIKKPLIRKPAYKGPITEELAREIFIGLGLSRSLNKTRETLHKIYGETPSDTAFKRWSAAEDWVARAAEHDAKLAVEAVRAVAATEAVGNTHKVFHAKDSMVGIAKGFADVLTDWQKAPAKSQHIKTANEAKALSDAAIGCIKLAEVLEGRVSDRQATEATITAEEVRKKAQATAKDSLARLSIAIDRQAREPDKQVH